MIHQVRCGLIRGIIGLRAPLTEAGVDMLVPYHVGFFVLFHYRGCRRDAMIVLSTGSARRCPLAVLHDKSGKSCITLPHCTPSKVHAGIIKPH